MKYQVLFSLKINERYIYKCRHAAVVIGAVRVKGMGFDTRLEGNAADCNWPGSH